MATGGHAGRPGSAGGPPPAVCNWQWAIVMSRTTGYADQVCLQSPFLPSPSSPLWQVPAPALNQPSIGGSLAAVSRRQWALTTFWASCWARMVLL